MRKMFFDTGTGWVQRRFAKPLVTGSIPARVSKYLDALCVPNWPSYKRQRRFYFGRMFALWVLRAPEDELKSFRGGLLYAIETIARRGVWTSDEVLSLREAAKKTTAATSEMEKYKSQAILARKELSQLKREAKK